MSSIFKLFGDSHQPETVPPAAAPAPVPTPVSSRPTTVTSTIQHDARLVRDLMQDHVSLVEHFTGLLPLLRDGDVKGFRAQLASFKTEFQGHIIKENVKFYVYLEQSLAGDDTNIELMRDFRREMNAISRAVVQFCNKYAEARVDIATIRQFELESGDIAQALLSRIEREERDLYSLYQ